MNIETANRLYELRKQQGLSQEELAEKLGVSRQAVSKWERSEASPDTDNLIALAKIYGLTLDELVYGKKDDQQSTEAESEVKKDTEKVDIGPTGIFVESADGDKVHININGIKVTADGKHHIRINDDGQEDEGDFDENNAPTTEGEPETKKDTDKVDIGPNGIFVESSDGETVQINLRGIKVTDGKHHIHINDDDDDDDDDDFDEDDVESIEKSGGKAKFWLSLPYPIICTIAYILLGCFDVLGGFGHSWIIFVTIPIYYSIVHAIAKKRFCDFAYPVFCAFTFLYLGMYHGNWHPSWVIFITIPVYYSIAGFLDKRRKEKENS